MTQFKMCNYCIVWAQMPDNSCWFQRVVADWQAIKYIHRPASQCWLTELPNAYKLLLKWFYNYMFIMWMNRIGLSAHNAIWRHGRNLPNGGRCMAIGCITGIGLIWGIIWGIIWGTIWGTTSGSVRGTMFFIDMFCFCLAILLMNVWSVTKS